MTLTEIHAIFTFNADGYIRFDQTKWATYTERRACPEWLNCWVYGSQMLQRYHPAGKADVKKQEDKKADAKKQEGNKADAKTQGGKKADATTQEGKKADAKKQEGKKADAKTQEGNKADAKKQEGKKADAKTQEGNKADAKKPEAPKTADAHKSGPNFGMTTRTTPISPTSILIDFD